MIYPTVKLLGRKPSRWFVSCGNLGGFLTHNPNATRSQRWQFQEKGMPDTNSFPSKRAALCWVRTGGKFVTKPVYVGGGRAGARRVR